MEGMMVILDWIRARKLYLFVALICLSAFALGYCGAMTAQVQGVLVLVAVAGMSAILGHSFDQHKQEVSDILGGIASAAAEVKQHDLPDATKQAETTAHEAMELASEVKKEQAAE
jgi:hypothetical protein